MQHFSLPMTKFGITGRSVDDVVTRIQLSMWVPEPEAGLLEVVRRQLDPVQSSLIPPHVTLCREDELALVEQDELISRFTSAHAVSITLRFGRAEPFHEHGILLPCIAGEQDFRALREHLLGTRAIRREAPHITLAHPRNPKGADNSLASAHALPETILITFTSVKLIEQVGIAPWSVLRAIELHRARPNNSFKPKPLRGPA